MNGHATDRLERQVPGWGFLAVGMLVVVLFKAHGPGPILLTMMALWVIVAVITVAVETRRLFA